MLYSDAMSKFLATAFAFFVFAGIELGAADLVPEPNTLGEEQIESPGYSEITVETVPAFAFVTIDGTFIGSSQWTGRLSPGMHLLNATGRDHYPTQFFFFTKENTRYKLIVRLEPYKGILSIVTNPSDAEILVDHLAVYGSIIELPVGTHTVQVRKFGYIEKSVNIIIRRDQTSFIRIDLQPSIFGATDFSVSRKVFNPSNSGLYGRTRFSFKVSAPGHGSIGIFDSGKRLIFKEDLAPFRTWSQGYTWNGTASDGSRVADGTYRVVIDLEAETDPASPPGEKPKTVEFNAEIRVDSLVRIVPAGFTAARPGLVFFPDPETFNLLPASLEFSAIWAGNDPGGTISGSVKASPSLVVAFSGGYDPVGAGNLAAGFGANIVHSALLNVALFGRLSWLEGVAPRFPEFSSEMEASLPLAIGAAGFRLGFAPGVVWDLAGNSISPRISAGIWYEESGMYAGISAQGTIGSGSFATIADPVLMAAEAHILFEGSPFILSFKMEGKLVPSFNSPVASIGFGIAF
jgi:hypothetical protein